MPKSVVLDDFLCIKGYRTVNEGYLVKWRGRMFVLGRPSLTLRQQKLVVLERFDGRLSLRFKGRDLEYRQVLEPKRPAPKSTGVKIRRKPPKYDPPPSHPWRHQIFGNDNPYETVSTYFDKNRKFSLCLYMDHNSLDFWQVTAVP